MYNHSCTWFGQYMLCVLSFPAHVKPFFVW